MEQKVKDFIKKNNLLSKEDVIGVAVSGGRDSMALLHFLHSFKNELNIEVVAINIDHSMRANSAMDSLFVKEYCADNKIRLFNFKVDVMKISVERKLGLEAAAREARYGTFEALIKKGLVDKIALGHHVSDQVETIMANILRGAAVGGAKGMEPIRDGIYIRPFLDTNREELTKFCQEHNLSYVEDESNLDIAFTRNFIRNEIMPLIKSRFKGAEKNILNFANACAEDDNYINSQVDVGSVMYYDNMVKIPIMFFRYSSALINRILAQCLNMLSGKIGNIERKHITMIKSFAFEGNNGTVISLPNGIRAHKEYDFITITTLAATKLSGTYIFKKGTLEIPGYGQIKVSSSKLRDPKVGSHIINGDAVPNTAQWRYRQDGDTFTPYKASGGKKLKDYLIDKKVPQRMRDNIPVLASGKEVLIIAGIEIADSVKVIDGSDNIYKITYIKDLV